MGPMLMLRFTHLQDRALRARKQPPYMSRQEIRSTTQQTIARRAVPARSPVKSTAVPVTGMVNSPTIKWSCSGDYIIGGERCMNT
jgi:hypothetical protein